MNFAWNVRRNHIDSRRGVIRGYTSVSFGREFALLWRCILLLVILVPRIDNRRTLQLRIISTIEMRLRFTMMRRRDDGWRWEWWIFEELLEGRNELELRFFVPTLRVCSLSPIGRSILLWRCVVFCALGFCGVRIVFCVDILVEWFYTVMRKIKEHDKHIKLVGGRETCIRKR